MGWYCGGYSCGEVSLAALDSVKFLGKKEKKNFHFHSGREGHEFLKDQNTFEVL